MTSLSHRYGLLAALGIAATLLILCLWAEDEREPGGPPLHPDWAGCVEVRGSDPPLCLYDPDRSLRLWLDHERAPDAQLTIDGSPVTPERYQVPELPGLGLRVSLPPHASTLEVRIPTTSPWTLQLRSRHDPDPLADELAAIDAHRHAVDESLHAGGDPTAARKLAEHAIVRALRSGLTSRATDIALMTAYYLDQYSDDTDGAHELLEGIRTVATSFPSGRADWESRRGLLLWSRGDLGGSAQAYRTATQMAMALEDAALLEEAMTMYSAVLAELGYFNAALHWSTTMLEQVASDSRYRGYLLETAAWVNLVLRRDGHPHVDPIAPYEEAVRLYSPSGDEPPSRELGWARLGLAEAYVLDGRQGEARSQLDLLGDAPLRLMDIALRDDLSLRIDLSQGADLARLEAGLQRLQCSAEDAGTPEARWWLAVRTGDVLARAGRWEEAIAAYREGEDRLDDLARLAAFGVGRAAVGAKRREGTLRLAEALVKQGRTAEALCALREAEARRLQTMLPGPLSPQQRALADAYVRKRDELDETTLDPATPVAERRRQQARRLRELEALRGQVNALLQDAGRTVGRPACRELSPRTQGELLLGLYPTEDAWLVLLEDDQGTTAHRIPGVELPQTPQEREALSDLLLGPLADRLEHADRLRVLASGTARHLDVQALPWRGQPLLAAITIVHGVDLPPASRADPSVPPHAWLVADPTQTLAGAEPEVAAAAAALRAAGFAAEIIAPDRATREELVRALADAELLHFSGHASYPDVDEHGVWPPYAGGTPGAASHLVLARGQSLAIHDIMLLHAVPETIVLEGCETGSLDPSIGGTSLAFAFVARGARAVVASPDPLPDELATALGEHLYDELPGGGRFDAAEALRHAQVELWGRVPEPERHLGRHRVWGP